jgi:hypothetical protein
VSTLPGTVVVVVEVVVVVVDVVVVVVLVVDDVEEEVVDDVEDDVEDVDVDEQFLLPITHGLSVGGLPGGCFASAVPPTARTATNRVAANASASVNTTIGLRDSTFIRSSAQSFAESPPTGGGAPAAADNRRDARIVNAS